MNCIKHTATVICHPSSNGSVESAVQSLKITMKKSVSVDFHGVSVKPISSMVAHICHSEKLNE